VEDDHPLKAEESPAWVTALRSRKKSSNREDAGSAMTPPTTSKRWLKPAPASRRASSRPVAPTR